MCVFNGCRSRRSNVLDSLDSLEDKKKFVIRIIRSLYWSLCQRK